MYIFLNVIPFTVPPTSLKKEMVTEAGFKTRIFQFLVRFNILFYVSQICNNEVLNMKKLKNWPHIQ